MLVIVQQQTEIGQLLFQGYVEETSESVDDIVDVEGSSVKDIVIVAVEGSSVDDIFAVEGSSIEYIVTVEGTSVDGIVAIDALLGWDVVVEAIVVVGVVDCFDVVDDTPVDVVSAGDDENVVVVVVVVFVIDGVV